MSALGPCYQNQSVVKHEANEHANSTVLSDSKKTQTLQVILYCFNRLLAVHTFLQLITFKIIHNMITQLHAYHPAQSLMCNGYYFLSLQGCSYKIKRLGKVVCSGILATSFVVTFSGLSTIGIFVYFTVIKLKGKNLIEEIMEESLHPVEPDNDIHRSGSETRVIPIPTDIM